METLLSETSRQLAGILFLALVTVETGGLYLLRKSAAGKTSPRFRRNSPAPAMPTPGCCWSSRWSASRSWTRPT
jgi:hypothetical protein